MFYLLITIAAAWLIPTTAASLYLLVLTLASARASVPHAATRSLFFDVIVPAHNEAAGIQRTVTNLHQLDWPADQFRVIVIADNCADETARLAREAGAIVLERHDTVNRGKGYALDYVFSWSRKDGKAAAVVVVDADSQTSANLLQAFAARLAGGSQAAQAHYGVLNTDASWRTRLMAIALGSIHKVRSRARERMGLSCGIRGNGWCVTHRLLDQIPYRAYSLTEDVEFGVDLGLAGHRIAYCDEAHVNGEMVSSESAARSQRQRWEGGRLALVRSRVPLLLRKAVTGPSAICLDLAVDLLVPPLSYVVLSSAAAVAVGLVSVLLSRSELPLLVLGLGLFNCAALAAYVGRGWALSGVGVQGFRDMLRVPGFIFWKLKLLAFGPKTTAWIRTRRERP